MDGKMLARLSAIIFVAIAITATAIEVTRKEEPAQVRPARALQPPRDPMRDSLRRCQQLGQMAVSNPDCLATWAESRDRFLGREPAPSAPQSSEGR